MWSGGDVWITIIFVLLLTWWLWYAVVAGIVEAVKKANHKKQKTSGGAMGVFSDIKGAVDVQKIKLGGKARLSIAQITGLVVNMRDAQANLPQHEFANVYQLYKTLRKHKTKKPLNYEDYLYHASRVVMEFNNLAPYVKFSGAGELESMLLLEEIEDLLQHFGDQGPVADFQPLPKERRRVPLSVLILVVLTLLGAGYGAVQKAQSVAYQQGYDEGAAIAFVEGQESKNTEINILKGANERLKTALDQQNVEMKGMRQEYNFFYNYAVIVTSAAGTKYHHYGCSHIEGRTFYIYNIDLAKSYGYTPCADCWG